MQSYQNWLDKTTPYVPYRWCSTIVMFAAFIFRIIFVQGWYIVAYCLGIYLLNLFLAFLQPKYDPSLHADDGLEDGESSLPTKQDQEFRPFVRRLPEFKFWRAATRAIGIAFICSWFSVFDLPVFWPVLVMYWVILFCLTSMRTLLQEKGNLLTNLPSATTDPTHDQVSIHTIFCGESEIWCQVRANSMRYLVADSKAWSLYRYWWTRQTWDRLLLSNYGEILIFSLETTI